MGWLRNRFGEASTHAGLATLAQVSKLFLPPQYHLLADSLTALFGAGAVAIPERR